MHGVKEIREDHSLAWYCYHIELQGSKDTDAYPVKGLDTHDDLVEQQGEPDEDLIIISLADGSLEHMIQISSNLD